MKKIRLMIVDDAQMFAELLAAIFQQEPDVQVVGTAGNGAQALALAQEKRPDLVILDIKLPGVSGLDLIAPLRTLNPALKIVMVSAFFDPYTVQRVLEAGGNGYVEKLSSISTLRAAIRCVRQGGTFFSPAFIAMQERLLNSEKAFHKILTQREQQILKLVAQGASDAEIAQQRSVSAHTISTHRKRIRRKLGLHCDRDMLAYARQWGLDSRGPAHTN